MTIKNNLTEDYCSLKVSKLLKEKGCTLEEDGRDAATHALAIKWIRENFGIYIQSPTPYTYRSKVNYEIRIWTKPYINSGFKTPEEATEAALLYTLTNLIK